MKFQGVPVHVDQYDTSIDGVFIKRIPLNKGVIVPQHAHSHSHATIVAKGKVRVWKNGDWWKDCFSGEILTIDAGTKHEFLALEDSEIYCVHNEEHALVVSENRLELA